MRSAFWGAFEKETVQGKFGEWLFVCQVYQVFSEGKKKVLAIKYVKLDCADDMTVQGYINEITLLQKLRRSENIIHLYD